MKIPVLLDCDPGHDDVMAILLAAQHLDLKGLTTVSGNAPLAQTTYNTRYTVELAGITHIPIAAGASHPMVHTVDFTGDIHGESGLDGPVMHEPEVAIRSDHAVDFIHEVVDQTDGVHIIATGMLTNIALVLRRYPGIHSKIASICLMGGSLTHGNVTPVAEFNIWADPEAAHVVFTSGISIKMVGLSVTRQVSAIPNIRQDIRNIGSHTAVAVADMLDFFSAQLEKLYGLPGASMHDPLAVVPLIDDRILTFQPMHVVIELTGTHTYGMTVCDYRERKNEDGTPAGKPPNADVAVSVDVDRFWALFLDTLKHYP